MSLGCSQKLQKKVGVACHVAYYVDVVAASLIPSTVCTRFACAMGVGNAKQTLLLAVFSVLVPSHVWLCLKYQLSSKHHQYQHALIIVVGSLNLS
jgi:hypothetical protein